MPRKLDENELFNYAISSLAARALSAGEVRTKLVRRAAEPSAVDAVLARLREYGYLDDNRFAEGYATARRDSGVVGKMRVMRGLRQRRVSSTVAGKAVEDAFAGVDETSMIEAWLERKYRHVKLREYLQDPKHLASVYRKLRYAGFNSGAAIGTLKHYAERADELEDDPAEEL